MGLPERLALYKQLEEARGGRPLIVYVTSTRPGLEGKMGPEAIPEFLDQLVALPANAEKVDLLVVSRGGEGMVAWRAMTLLHARMKHVAVLIPQVAYSAATLLAMGANEIVMHPHGNLGPVDPQIEITKPGEGGQPPQKQHFGFEDLASFLEFAKKEVGLTDQEHVRHMFEMFCKQVGPVPVAVAARASQLTVTMGKKLLSLHMANEQQAQTIAETLNKSFFDHGYPVSRREAKEDIKLPIADENPKVEDLMWKIWLDIETELQARKPFNPLAESLSNPAVAPILLRDVSQPILPPVSQVGQQIIQNFQIPQVNPASKAVLPGVADLLEQAFQSSVVRVPLTDFEVVTAIMESRRVASHERAKGKILACRLPDLNFRISIATTSAGWAPVTIGPVGP